MATKKRLSLIYDWPEGGKHPPGMNRVNIWNVTYCNLKLVVNKPSYKVLKLGTFIYIKVVIAVNIQGIDRLVLCDNKVLQQLTQATFLYIPDNPLREKNHW